MGADRGLPGLWDQDDLAELLPRIHAAVGGGGVPQRAHAVLNYIAPNTTITDSTPATGGVT